MSDQLALFDAAPALPDGFRYRPDVLPADEERALLRLLRAVPFCAFEFHGHTAKRRTVSFGWRYDFATESLREAEPIPDFLEPLRARAAGPSRTEWEHGTAGVDAMRCSVTFRDLRAAP